MPETVVDRWRLAFTRRCYVATIPLVPVEEAAVRPLAVSSRERRRRVGGRTPRRGSLRRGRGRSPRSARRVRRRGRGCLGSIGAWWSRGELGPCGHGVNDEVDSVGGAHAGLEEPTGPTWTDDHDGIPVGVPRVFQESRRAKKVGITGWRGRARTCDLLIQSQAFCQLNYPPPGRLGESTRPAHFASVG
jgi:hypothetical protein